MKTLSLLLICLGTLACAQNSKYNRLVWQDEFDGNSLDRAKWQYENHCAPQNQELQCYTPRTNNVYVQNGNLHIKAIPETYGNKRFTSGRINTKHSAAWKYGRFEVRAKLPKGDYLWPAFWMLPRDYVFGGWAASGEIDIMEYRGQRTRQVSNALHYGGAWPNNAHVGSGPIDFNFDFSADYHTFTLIWERDQMQWFVDGKVIATRSLTRSWYSGRGKNPYTDIRQPFDQPFFFLINMATGGNFFGGESQSLTTAIGQRWENPILMVDYVRVYQEGDGGVNPNPIPVPSSNVKTTAQATKATQSVGVSRVASSAATSAVSSAASSAASSAESSAGTTFAYTRPQETKTTPTVTEAEEGDECNGKCGAASCCPDQKLGVVCFSENTHVCASDSSNGRKSLCGKGSGACNSVCFDSRMYKCENGAIRLL